MTFYLCILPVQLSVFASLAPEGACVDNSDMYDLLENCGISSSSSPDLPHRTSDVLVVGRSHEYVEDERKFRIPVFCSYCDGMLQRKCGMEWGGVRYGMGWCSMEWDGMEWGAVWNGVGRGAVWNGVRYGVARGVVEWGGVRYMEWIKMQ